MSSKDERKKTQYPFNWSSYFSLNVDAHGPIVDVTNP